jgi:glycosyltransferase involved in cell wall biosynthesis
MRLKIFLKSPIYYHVPIYEDLGLKSPDLDFCVYYWSRAGIDPYVDKELPNVRRTWITEKDLKHPHRFLPSINLSKFDNGFLPRISPHLWIKVLLSSQNDILFLQGLSNFDEIVSLMVSKLNRSKVVLRGEGVPSSSSWIKIIFKKWLIRHVSILCFSTQKNKEYWENHMSADAYLLPYPSVSFIDKQPNNLTRKKQIVVASRFTPRKNIEKIIDLYYENFVDDYTLIMCGDGDPAYLQTLREKLDDLDLDERVHFTGFIDHTKVIDIFLESEIYINLSYHDPSPKALNEALACGLRCIISNLVGTADDLRDRNDVYVYNIDEKIVESGAITDFVNLPFNENLVKPMPTREQCVETLCEICSD